MKGMSGKKEDTSYSIERGLFPLRTDPKCRPERNEDLPILARRHPFPTDTKCRPERSEGSPPFMFSRGSLEGDLFTPSIELETPHCVRGDNLLERGLRPLSNRHKVSS